MPPGLKVALAGVGLLSLIGVNYVAAMSLDSGNPKPIVSGVRDIVNNPGWELASYQLYPWWMSTQFEIVEVRHLGSPSTERQISLDTLGVSIPSVHLDTTEEPIDIAGISERDLNRFLEHRKTSDGHKVLCRRSPPQRGLCDFFIAWDASRTTAERVEFVAADFGQAGFGLVDLMLLKEIAPRVAKAVSDTSVNYVD
jgi:hypothetical protein